MKFMVEHMVDSVGQAGVVVEAPNQLEAIRAVQASQPGFDVEVTSIVELAVNDETVEASVVWAPAITEDQDPEEALHESGTDVGNE